MRAMPDDVGQGLSLFYFAGQEPGAVWDVFEIDREQRGDGGDIAFLEAVFHKLMHTKEQR